MKRYELESKNIAYIHKLVREDKKALTPSYQRKEGVWSLEANQMLIYSIIKNDPIPTLCFRVMNNDKYEVVDGRQRLKAVTSYLLGDFKLPSNIKDLDGMVVADCTFDKLDDLLKERFRNFNLYIYFLYDYSNEEAASDHKKAWAKGGPTSLENGQLLCKSCNSRKGNKDRQNLCFIIRNQ